MPPIGYLFVVVGIVILRQTIVGRVTDIPSDAKDLANAFLTNDMTGVSEVLSRRGEASVTGELGSAPVTGSYPNNDLVNECVRLGDAARGYLLGATGPNYFDCSGLIWRAMVNLGLYNGARFTTSTFAALAPQQGWQKVASPSPGNIVLWKTKHMGVSLGGDRMYSARSRAKGIGESSVSGDSSYFGYEPEYYAVSERG